MSKYKVAVIGEMPAKGYSGGRYHAWIMAEALAEQGNDVYVITNNIPEFSRDFEGYKAHGKIQTVLTGNFYEVSIEDSEIDYVICVPSLGGGKAFYYACMDLAIQKKAKFIFVNFETPNWYRLYVKMNRPEGDYEILRNICKHGCLIFSSAYESQKYAQEFYNKYKRKTDFCVWSPPINSVLADSVKEEKQNQILVFLRIKDKHKGGDDFLKLLGEHLRGMTCVCISGTADIDPAFLKEANEIAQKFGIELRYEKSLSDIRKFEEIKRSKLLLFPSHFEGYGYPPVEALYCGTRCVVYDLPVLKEISGNHLTYCEVNNFEMMKQQAAALLLEPDIKPTCVDTADFYQQSIKLQRILDENYGNEKLIIRNRTWKRLQGRIRKWYYVKFCTRSKLVPDIIKDCVNSNYVLSNKLEMKDQKKSLIKKQLKGKKAYVWGCGRAYRELYPKVKSWIKLSGVLDGNPEKQGTLDRVSGKFFIQSPKELCNIEKDDVVVFISNKEHVDEIIDELEIMGIKKYYSLCMIESNSLTTRIYKKFKKENENNEN